MSLNDHEQHLLKTLDKWDKLIVDEENLRKRPTTFLFILQQESDRAVIDEVVATEGFKPEQVEYLSIGKPLDLGGQRSYYTRNAEMAAKLIAKHRQDLASAAKAAGYDRQDQYTAASRYCPVIVAAEPQKTKLGCILRNKHNILLGGISPLNPHMPRSLSQVIWTAIRPYLTVSGTPKRGGALAKPFVK